MFGCEPATARPQRERTRNHLSTFDHTAEVNADADVDRVSLHSESRRLDDRPPARGVGRHDRRELPWRCASRFEAQCGVARVSALLQSEGVTALPDYVQAPLEVEAKCTSPKITRNLECIVKADRLLTLLEALRLSGLVTTSEYERRVRQAVRRLVSFGRMARRTAFGLRKRVALKSAGARAAAEAAGALDQAPSEAVAPQPVANGRPGVATQPEAAEMS
jgi:hypothetical protein